MAFDIGKVRKDIRQLRKFLKHAPKHATPDKVHSLRTSIRRFEAAMQALELDAGNERELLRTLAKLRKRTGKVRDTDMLTGYVATLTISGEEDCRVQLLEYLGAEHARRIQQLHAFAVKQGKSLRHRLKRTSSLLKMSDLGAKAKRSAPGKAMLSELRLQREVTASITLNSTNLHPYRLLVKELRYMLQLARDPADNELIEILGNVKDAIGEWHDWQQLLAIAGEHLHHGNRCKLISLLRTTTQQKLKRALAVTQAGRKHMRRSSMGVRRNG